MPGIKDDYTQDQLLNMLYKEVASIARGLKLPYNGKKIEIAQSMLSTLSQKINQKEQVEVQESDDEQEESDEEEQVESDDEQEKKATSKLGKINIKLVKEEGFDNMMGSDGAESLYEDGLHKLHPRIAFIYHVHREQFNDGTCELEDSIIKNIRSGKSNNTDDWLEIYKKFNKC
ncbi:hypothetical protein DFA_07062 [Cavenderia fasciculata]|uniref:Uncharacterized protein n=1 Tax=Cavenderia fasciculata TaxID=261658 RepID=F4PVD8_CACFS|nr:uncharacterized protein DFA_07062 [Cavenderia fasciculata]EGG19952.1 hypothetical protein DFA_07062 [Cavenderia fasciculata]|eukprot:XP_004366935.1 hypothetical protein DFA_07062 [Cavenderia fasciculata]